MKAMTIMALFIWIGFLPGLATAEIQTAKHTVTLEDASGDVNDNGDDPGKDVVKVILDTDGKNLNITVVLAKEVKFYLDGHMAGDVVDVILDTDNDTTTGGKPFSYEDSGGFEFKIEVGACIEYEGGGMACAGALKGSKAINFFSTYSLEKYTEGSNSERISEAFNWKALGKDIKGNQVEVSVPYSEMKLSPGQSIRCAVKERDDSSFKKEYLPEVLLTIK